MSISQNTHFLRDNERNIWLQKKVKHDMKKSLI